MGFRDGNTNNEYDNTNRGAIFKAKEKRTERSPDRTGEITVFCPHCKATTEFWLSGWIKKARSGQVFLSLACNPKEDVQGQTSDDIDEDIPF
jgi:hypothetical protein